MSLKSKTNRDSRKNTEATRERERQARRALRQFYVAIDPKTQEGYSFTNDDGMVTTYAAVGGMEIRTALATTVKEAQEETVTAMAVPRTEFYKATMIRMPVMGVNLLGLVSKDGVEMIPMTPNGAKWLRGKNFLVPELKDEMEVMIYSAGRIATHEFGRKFEDIKDVSSIIPPDLIQAMEGVTTPK